MQIADVLAEKSPVDARSSPSVKSSTLRNAFYITPFVCVIGGAFFLATALVIQKDRERAEKITKGKCFNKFLEERATIKDDDSV